MKNQGAVFKTFANRGFQHKTCKKKIIKKFVAIKKHLYLLLLKKSNNIYYEQS